MPSVPIDASVGEVESSLDVQSVHGPGGSPPPPFPKLGRSRGCWGLLWPLV